MIKSGGRKYAGMSLNLNVGGLKKDVLSTRLYICVFLAKVDGYLDRSRSPQGLPPPHDVRDLLDRVYF